MAAPVSPLPMLDRPTLRIAVRLVGVFCLGACSASYHKGRVDRQTTSLVRERTDDVLGRRAETIYVPKLRSATPTAPMGQDSSEEAIGPAPLELVELSLARALEIAVGGNRDYKSRLEDLALTAISVLSARQIFAPQLAAILGYFYSDAALAEEVNEASASFSVAQALRWGGNLTLEASSLRGDDGFGPKSYDPAVSIRLTQPLLRGGGYRVNQEPLVQAERNLIYEIRLFELFREDFSIDVARRYYNLVQQQQSIENQQENMSEFTFARRQAEALFNVGRARELDVLRARRQELNSENALIAAIEGFKFDLDSFRIFLGLPRTVELSVADEAPEFVVVDYDPDSAVEVALANRLDVMNRREQLWDAARAVEIARNGLLPDLDLSLNYGLGDSDSAGSFGSQDLDRENYSARVTLGLPLNRVDERLAYRSVLIAQQRAIRGLEQFEDTVTIGVRRSIRELDRRRQSVAIQEEQIAAEEKNVRIAKIQFEQGEVDNRDVVDAQQSLLNARNRLINEQVNYEIARLQLLRDLGILFIDDQGMWVP